MSAEDVQLTSFVDISSGVNKLRNLPYKVDDVDECCNYKYQILDKFCATRNAVSSLNKVWGGGVNLINAIKCLKL